MKKRLLQLVLSSFVCMNIFTGDAGPQSLRDGSIIFTAGPVTHAVVDVSDVFTESQLRQKLSEQANFYIPYENYIFMTKNAQGEEVPVELDDWGDLHISENNILGIPHVWIDETEAPVPPEAVGAPDLEGEVDDEYFEG